MTRFVVYAMMSACRRTPAAQRAWKEEEGPCRGSAAGLCGPAIDQAARMSFEKENPMVPSNQDSQAPDRCHTLSRGDAGRASARPMSPARSGLGAPQHICAFFHSYEEEYRVLLPFIQEGLERGEKAIHIVDPSRRDTHLQRLAAAGIDMATAQQHGQFELYTWAEAHLRDGAFDPDRMFALTKEVVMGARQHGFPCTRFVTHMEWALEAHVDATALLEYEARANARWLHDNDLVFCTYDLARFGGRLIVDIMRTHPMLLIGGLLYENPFFVPPEEFLQELHTRRVDGEISQ